MRPGNAIYHFRYRKFLRFLAETFIEAVRPPRATPRLVVFLRFLAETFIEAYDHTRLNLGIIHFFAF